MDASSIKAMMSEIAPVIREFFDAGIAPVMAENKALAARVAELEVQLPVPVPLTMDEVRAVAVEVVQTAVSVLPEPEPLPDVAALVKAAAAEEVSALAATLPLPEKGDAGPQGEPGEKGDPGEVDMDAVKALIDAAVAALPPAERGEKGERGEDGAPGENGADGAPGEPGRDGSDGVGLADALKDAEGNLILVMADGRTKSLGPIDGKDGLDGITPTFLDAEFEGRTLRLKFDGERSCEFQLATPEYCGVFKETGTYESGDIVTWGGSAWHCDEPKGLKPGAPDSGWTLMVKAGRPGKDAGK